MGKTQKSIKFNLSTQENDDDQETLSTINKSKMKEQYENLEKRLLALDLKEKESKEMQLRSGNRFQKLKDEMRQNLRSVKNTKKQLSLFQNKENESASSNESTPRKATDFKEQVLSYSHRV